MQGVKRYEIFEIKRVQEYMFAITITGVYEDEYGNKREYVEFCDVYSLKGLKIDPIFSNKAEFGDTKYNNYLVGFNVISNNVKKLYFDFIGESFYNVEKGGWEKPTNAIIDLDGRYWQNDFLLAQETANIINPLLAVQKQYNVL